jgi:hypothetical protein
MVVSEEMPWSLGCIYMGLALPPFEGNTARVLCGTPSLALRDDINVIITPCYYHRPHGT